jgi:hypothetical protein
MIQDPTLEEYRLPMEALKDRFKINNPEQSFLPSDLNSTFR